MRRDETRRDETRRDETRPDEEGKGSARKRSLCIVSNRTNLKVMRLSRFSLRVIQRAIFFESRKDGGHVSRRNRETPTGSKKKASGRTTKRLRNDYGWKVPLRATGFVVQKIVRGGPRRREDEEAARAPCMTARQYGLLYFVTRC